MSGPSLQAIAHHEAGHAVMCWYEKVGVDLTSILPSGPALGRVTHRSVLDDIDLACDNSIEGKARAESLIRISLAGSLAQRRFNPRAFRYDNSRSDYNSAATVLWHLVGSDDEFSAYWRLLEIQTKNTLNLDFVWERVERVATTLLSGKELSRDDLEALLE